MKRLEFAQTTKERALIRQKHKCASCGENITSIRAEGKISHKYGEAAHGHHMRHAQQAGTNELSNCVIICESCHYTAHSGGHYRNKEDYLITTVSDYPYFNG